MSDIVGYECYKEFEHLFLLDIIESHRLQILPSFLLMSFQNIDSAIHSSMPGSEIITGKDYSEDECEEAYQSRNEWVYIQSRQGLLHGSIYGTGLVSIRAM